MESALKAASHCPEGGLLTAPQPQPLPQPQSLLPHRRGGGAFSRAETRKRVAAQLDTLIEQGVRHVVLSAFGCGAFRNPADEVASVYRLTLTPTLTPTLTLTPTPPLQVAAVYRQELQKRSTKFDVVGFGIFHPNPNPSPTPKP